MQVVETQDNPYDLKNDKKPNIENSFENFEITNIMEKFDQSNNTQITKITDAMINKTENDITKFENQNDEWVTKITNAMINKTEEKFFRFEEKNNKMEDIFFNISNLIRS